MGLDFAIDQLYATRWSTLDTGDCERHTDGRVYPSIERVRREFDSAGAELTITHVQLFDCYRAEWTGGEGGSVVGQSEVEAAVYALAQFRRAAAVQPA